jgi:hypothetical protein
MNIFCLSTGRCGSTTFARSFEHLTNYTSGHETRSRILGKGRLDYPDQHIESDNRLAWFLGGLEKKYGDSAIYVHLTRDVDQVIDSYSKRYNPTWQTGIIFGYAHSILMRNEYLTQAEIKQVAGMYVETVTDNILHFLSTKSRVVNISIDNPMVGVNELWNIAGFQGDREACELEWRKKYNNSF